MIIHVVADEANRIFRLTTQFPHLIWEAIICQAYNVHRPFTNIDKYNHEQEHPRGNIVELQCIHQDGLNSLSYEGLKIPMIIAHVYDIF